VLPLSAVLVQIVVGVTAFLAIRLYQPSLPIGPASVGAFVGYAMNTTIILMVWCLVYLLHAEWTKRRLAEREHWENEIRLRDLELQFLRSQINSHFVFNALNNIRSLILEDTEAARRALTDLAALLRGLMNNEAKATVSLREETEGVKGYLALEALQLERRLTYELDVAPELLDARLPPLLLQTLVENAIKHGIARRRSGGCVRISAAALPASRWRLRVENPPAELPAAHEGSGIGLRNARARLEAAFGDRATLELTSGSNVLATAEMPL
jgi:LytS/YehU family sensor histidine kinase